jgi:hypothetical protein
MAKNAKQVEIEVTPKLIKKLISDILAEYGELESARGAFMNRARRIRERIGSHIEGAAARGIPAKISKLTIKIQQTQIKLQGLMAELDSEERRLLKRIITAHGDKAQLQLFADLPPALKPPKEVVIEAAKGTKKPPKRKQPTPPPEPPDEPVDEQEPEPVRPPPDDGGDDAPRPQAAAGDNWQ